MALHRPLLLALAAVRLVPAELNASANVERFALIEARGTRLSSVADAKSSVEAALGKTENV